MHHPRSTSQSHTKKHSQWFLISVCLFVGVIAFHYFVPQLMKAYADYIVYFQAAFFTPFLLIGGVVLGVVRTNLLSAKAYGIVLVFGLFWNAITVVILFVFTGSMIPSFSGGSSNFLVYIYFGLVWLFGFFKTKHIEEKIARSRDLDMGAKNNEVAKVFAPNLWSKLSGEESSEERCASFLRKNGSWVKEVNESWASHFYPLLAIILFLFMGFAFIYAINNRGPAGFTAVVPLLVLVSGFLIKVIDLSKRFENSTDARRLIISEEEESLIYEGGFLGHFSIPFFDVNNILYHSWKTTSRNNNSTKTTWHYECSLHLKDGNILKMDSTTDEEGPIEDLCEMLMDTIGVEVIDISGDSSIPKEFRNSLQKDGDRRDIGQVPSREDVDEVVYALGHESTTTVYREPDFLTIHYKPQLTKAGSFHLAAFPMYWACFTGVILSVIYVFAATSIPKQYVPYLAAGLVLVGIIFLRLKSRGLTQTFLTSKKLSCYENEIKLTTSAGNREFEDSFDPRSLDFARVLFNLESSDASLEIGGQAGKATIAELAWGWTEGKVQDFRHVERLLEKQYDLY